MKIPVLLSDVFGLCMLFVEILETVGFPIKTLSIFKLHQGGKLQNSLEWKIFTSFHIKTAAETKLPCSLPFLQHFLCRIRTGNS